MHVGRRELRASARVTCRKLPQGVRGVLAVGGLLAPSRTAVARAETLATSRGTATAAAAKPCDGEITISIKSVSVTRLQCYTHPMTLGPWQTGFMGSVKQRSCLGGWRQGDVLLKLMFQPSLDVDPYTYWYSYAFGFVTNWLFNGDITASFASSCFKGSYFDIVGR